MPLIKSNTPEVISKNIKTEIKAGKNKEQAIAIALNVAKKSNTPMSKGKTK